MAGQAVVGLDGCASGWIAVVLRPGDGPCAHHVATIGALAALVPDAAVIGIDMPIGLPAAGRRASDDAARALLRARRHSVFVTPVRAALEEPTHLLATATAVRLTGAGISRQAYGLREKILEVERWLPSAPCPVREVHPEVSFATMTGHPATASKKTWAGQVERRRALAAAGIDLDDVDRGAAAACAADDMLDAGAVAWTADRVRRGVARSLPDPPEVGPAGELLAIWA